MRPRAAWTALTIGRSRPAEERLARLIDRRLTGIVMNDHTDDRGQLVFEQACRMGLEGIVSNRLAAPYRSGRDGLNRQ
jgi:bifunctional non-homologous end joining protein LigD